MGFIRCAPWMSMHVIAVMKGSMHQLHFNGWNNNNNKKNKWCFSESFFWKLMTLYCTTPRLGTSQSEQSIEIICSSHNPLWQYLSVDNLEFACEWGSNVYAKCKRESFMVWYCAAKVTSRKTVACFNLDFEPVVSCKLRAILLLQAQLCTHLHLYFGFSMVAFFFLGAWYLTQTVRCICICVHINSSYSVCVQGVLGAEQLHFVAVCL